MINHIQNLRLSHPKTTQILIFLWVGGTSALLDIGLFYLCHRVASWDIYTSAVIAYLVSLVYNYLLHTYLTFERKAETGNLFKFAVLVIVNYSLTALLLYFLVDIASINAIWAKILTIPIIAVNTFIVSKKWIYR